MWERHILEKKRLLFLQVRSRRVEQVQESGEKGDTRRSWHLKQAKKVFEFGLPSIIGHSQRNITVQSSSSSFLSSVSEDLFKLILSFSLKSTPPNCLLSNPLHSRRFQIRNTVQKWFIHIKRKCISCSRSKRYTYLPDFPALLFQKIKTSCVCNLCNVFVIYALGSVHEKFTFESEPLRSRIDRLAMANLILGSI